MATKEDESRLAALEAECARLRDENTQLKRTLGFSGKTGIRITDTDSTVFLDRTSTSDKKIQLFLNLFRGRDDVYPLRWESGGGKSGYSPACANEWDRLLCGKPRVKCANCENRQFIPVSAGVLHGHLSGKYTIGVYPILKDETCWFLTVDFDKSGWELDALAFLNSCDTLGIPAYLERSRSGLGGHIWLFFDSPISAKRARSPGAAVLTSTMEQRLCLR